MGERSNYVYKESSHKEDVLMNEKGDIIKRAGKSSAELQVKPLLKTDNPVLHVMIQAAWKTCKKKGKR